jgi:hypothetical protein
MPSSIAPGTKFNPIEISDAESVDIYDDDSPMGSEVVDSGDDCDAASADAHDKLVNYVDLLEERVAKLEKLVEELMKKINV